MTRNTPKSPVTFRAPFVRCQARGYVFLSLVPTVVGCDRTPVPVRAPIAATAPGI